jgi:hypothetical protein
MIPERNLIAGQLSPVASKLTSRRTGMAGNLIGVPSRSVIFICGTISPAVGRVGWELFTFQSQYTEWRLLLSLQGTIMCKNEYSLRSGV